MKKFIVDHLPNFLVRTFAKPYVSGDSLEKGIKKVDELWNEKGLASTLDLLGEAVYDKAGVEANIKLYLDVIDQAKGREYVTISMKPSSLGYHESYEYCFANIDKLLTSADEKGIKITLDMEDHTFTDDTLRLYRELLAKHPTFGTVLQSRLYRTDKDIENLIDLNGRIRICIGIYSETQDIALTNKAEMKVKMLENAETLVKNGFYVEFATHDQNTIRDFLKKIDENGWTSEQVEFQQLLGVPMSKLQKEILERGFTDRLYVPFAVGWKNATPYLKRRLANNPRMAIYVVKHMFTR